MVRRTLEATLSLVSPLLCVQLLPLALSACDGIHTISISGIVVDAKWRDGIDGDPLGFLDGIGWPGPAACFPIKGAEVGISLSTFGRAETFNASTNDGGFYQFSLETIGGTRNPYSNLKIRIDAPGYTPLEREFDAEQFYTRGPRSASDEVLLPLHRAELRSSTRPEAPRPIPLIECEALTEQQKERLRFHESELRERQLSAPTR